MAIELPTRQDGGQLLVQELANRNPNTNPTVSTSPQTSSQPAPLPGVNNPNLQNNPSFSPNQDLAGVISGGIQPVAGAAGSSTGSFNFNSTGGTPQDPNVPTPGLDQLSEQLQQRASGEGLGPDFESFFNQVGNPIVQQIDEQIKVTTDSAIEDLVSRGVLTSSTTVKQISQIALQGAQRKAALVGQLATDFERDRQNRIDSALQQLGVLEQGKLQSKTAITVANIGATATIQAAARQAGATVKAAQINAQASLQRAGLDARVALQLQQNELNQSFEQQGIDPGRFQNDPVYRGNVLDFLAEKEHTIFELQKAVLEQEVLGL